MKKRYYLEYYMLGNKLFPKSAREIFLGEDDISYFHGPVGMLYKSVDGDVQALQYSTSTVNFDYTCGGEFDINNDELIKRARQVAKDTMVSVYTLNKKVDSNGVCEYFLRGVLRSSNADI